MTIFQVSLRTIVEMYKNSLEMFENLFEEMHSLIVFGADRMPCFDESGFSSRGL